MKITHHTHTQTGSKPVSRTETLLKNDVRAEQSDALFVAPTSQKFLYFIKEPLNTFSVSSLQTEKWWSRFRVSTSFCLLSLRKTTIVFTVCAENSLKKKRPVSFFNLSQFEQILIIKSASGVFITFSVTFLSAHPDLNLYFWVVCLFN